MEIMLSCEQLGNVKYSSNRRSKVSNLCGCSMQILQHVSECLVDLHGAGYVHRDVKPANIMWLPSQNRWTLIDFGCTARIGEQARLSFSLLYAAPEVLRAYYRSDMKTIEATAAVDAWSVGIIAMELFSAQPALQVLMGQEKVRASAPLIHCTIILHEVLPSYAM